MPDGNVSECATALVYHEMYDGRGFSRLERSWGRYRAGMDRLAELGLIQPDWSDAPNNPAAGYLPVYRPQPASLEQLATVHSPEHIRRVLEMDRRGSGFFDRNDTPAWPGVYRRAALAVGGTLLAADLVATGQASHVFHPAGGLHHAAYDKVSGFCIFNDIVAAVRLWQTRYGYERIAVLDVDGHHGDGTQSLLYREPVLTVSLHMYDGRFFPGTGAVSERGEGRGRGYCLNLPLPRFTTDADYLRALEIALREIENYRPQAMILQYGVDGHFSDRMVGLKLSTYAYEEVARRVHQLAHRLCEGRLVAVSGGGYEPEAVARCWALLVANLAGKVEALGEHYGRLHDPPAALPPPRDEAQTAVDRLLQALNQML